MLRQGFSQFIQSHWLWRHHLVTTTVGKSLAKMNQGTINALIAFLVWIVFFHSSSCNAFVLGVQVFCSPKTPSKINNALSFGGKSNKSFNNETVSSFQLVVASVANNFLKGSTNNSPEKATLLSSSFLSLTTTALLVSSFLSQMTVVQLQLWVSCTFMSHSEWKGCIAPQRWWLTMIYTRVFCVPFFQ